MGLIEKHEILFFWHSDNVYNKSFNESFILFYVNSN